MAIPRTPPALPRVHYVHTPDPALRATSVILIVLAAVASIALSSCLLTAIARRFFNTAGPEPTPEITALCLSLIFGPACVLLVTAFLRERHFERLRPYRARRLKALSKDQRAWLRLPHRIVEHRFRATAPSRQTIEKLLRHLPPGHVFFLNPPGPRAARPTANDVSFELIDILDEADRLASLITLNIEQQTGCTLSAHTTNPATISTGLRNVSHFVQRNFRFLFWVCFFAFAAFRNRTWRDLLILGGIVGLYLLIAQFQFLLAETRWYLAPGQLIQREYRAWPKVASLRIFSPLQHSLIMDARAGRAFVLHEGRSCSVPAPGWTAWAIAAGWISSAPPPTLDQIQMLLGSFPIRPGSTP